MKSIPALFTDQWSAEIYDHQVQGLDDLSFWTSVAEGTGKPVLELACGTGRLTIPFAQAGFDLTGLDSSAAMLAVANRKLGHETEELRRTCRFTEGDMTDFTIEREFGLIFIPAISFQALLTREDQRKCLVSCRDHLADDGYLAFNVFNPSLQRLLAKQVDEEPRVFAGPSGPVKLNSVTNYDQASQTLRASWHYEEVDHPGIEHDYALALRYSFRYEVEWMLDACGFSVDALYGDANRSEFTAASSSMFFVARKA